MAAGLSMRRWLQLSVGLGLSALFLYLAFRGEDWSAVRTEVAHADYRWLVAMAVVGVYALYVRCQRWQLLLEAAVERPVPMQPIFSATAIGFMANMVLPFRVGEFARPFLLSRGTGLPLSVALATGVLERAFDLLALFIFGVWVVSTADVPPVVYKFTWIAGAMVAVVLGAIVVMHLQRDRVLPLVDRMWDLLPARVGGQIKLLEHEFLDALSTVADLGLLLRTTAWSIYLWLAIAVGFALGFPALGIDVPFVGGGVATAAIVALAVSVPGAPGFVGQFEWGCKLALEGVYGVPGAQAVGFAIVVHILQFVVQVGVGLVYLVREGLSLGDLGRMREGAETPARPG
jgi:uncharacterized protein (TIRG00374 family)